MEKKYESVTLDEIARRFPTKEACLEYIAGRKWHDGFSCIRCRHKRYSNGMKYLDRQCNNCHYIESPTANTLFHKVKFSLVKAFRIVHLVSTTKTGIASTTLSRLLGLRQKTCHLFKLKVMQAMRHQEGLDRCLEGLVEVGVFETGNVYKSAKGEKKSTRRKILLGIEKKGKGVSRMEAVSCCKATCRKYEEFIMSRVANGSRIEAENKPSLRHIDPDKECKLFLTDPKENKGRFTRMVRVRTLLTNRLKAIHGHVKYLDYYLAEYSYRHNRFYMKGEILDDLLSRMIGHAPRPRLSLIM